MIDPEPPSLEDLAPAALVYHENSKINDANRDYLAETIGEFSADLDELRRSTTGVKTYPNAGRVDLANLVPKSPLRMPMDSVMKSRRSVRDFSSRPLALPALAALLETACGVTGTARHPDHPEIVQPLRAYPSGGAIYAVESYIVAFAVDGVAPGVYHYHPIDRCLEVVRRGALRTTLEPIVLTESGRLEAPALLVLSGRWQRLLEKYGERGYRVLLLEAGHAAGNLLLAAASLDLAACPLAGFLDDQFAAQLRLDPREEPVLYVIMLGLPREP